MNPTIKKLSPHIAAEVFGVDLRHPIGAETAELVRDALYEHAVLLFRDQEITDDQHVAFSEIFGALEMTSPTDPIGDGGPVGVISNLDQKGDIIPSEDPRVLYLVGNSLWHSDGSFKKVPLRASLLLAKVKGAIPNSPASEPLTRPCPSKNKQPWKIWWRCTVWPIPGKRSLPTW